MFPVEERNSRLREEENPTGCLSAVAVRSFYPRPRPPDPACLHRWKWILWITTGFFYERKIETGTLYEKGRTRGNIQTTLSSEILMAGRLREGETEEDGEEKRGKEKDRERKIETERVEERGLLESFKSFEKESIKEKVRLKERRESGE